MDLRGALEVNTWIWVAGNMVLTVILLVAVLTAVLYPIFFNPRLTSAGTRIWFTFGAIALFSLSAFLGIFIDGSVDWRTLPPFVDWWRPAFRLAVYLTVAFTFGSLLELLIRRRFFPDSVRIRLDTGPVTTDFPEETLDLEPRPTSPRRRRRIRGSRLPR